MISKHTLIKYNCLFVFISSFCTTIMYLHGIFSDATMLTFGAHSTHDRELETLKSKMLDIATSDKNDKSKIDFIEQRISERKELLVYKTKSDLLRNALMILINVIFVAIHIRVYRKITEAEQ